MRSTKGNTHSSAIHEEEEEYDCMRPNSVPRRTGLPVPKMGRVMIGQMLFARSTRSPSNGGGARLMRGCERLWMLRNQTTALALLFARRLSIWPVEVVPVVGRLKPAVSQFLVREGCRVFNRRFSRGALDNSSRAQLFPDIYCKNEHRLACTSDVCTATERDRFEKSVSYFKANTGLPCKLSRLITTIYDNQFAAEGTVHTEGPGRPNLLYSCTTVKLMMSLLRFPCGLTTATTIQLTSDKL